MGALRSAQRQIVRRQELFEVASQCPERPYLEIQIPPDCLQVHHVVIETISRDQGWCSEEGAHPYDRSYTWFDVYLRKKSLRHNSTIDRIKAIVNRRGDPTPFQHLVRYGQDGLRATWIKSLMAGDVIEMVPRAEYKMWVNIVSGVTIEVYYEVNRPHSDISLATISTSQDPIYSPIDSRAGEVRVLVLQPGDFDTPLQCHLITMSTSDPNRPKFEAISYCWGEQSEKRDLVLRYQGGDHVVSIARSVADVLRYLRYPRKERILWIDALCINQADVEERAEQVVRMASIYAVAEEVAVFLGPEDKVMRLGFQMVRAAHNYKNPVCAGGSDCSCQGTSHILTPRDITTRITVEERAGNNWLSAVTWAVRDSEPDRYEDSEISRRTPSHHVLMAYVFSNPYFSRVWVLQEVFNAKKAIVYSGRESVLLPELLEVHTYSSSDWRIAHLEPIRRLPQIWNKLIKYDAVATPAPDQSPVAITATKQITRPQMLEVFLDSLELNASDARDKIFATLSFGDETHNSAAIPDLIRPNYKKSLEEVFADFTRWWIISHGSLGVLSAIHGQIGRTWQDMTSSNKITPQIPKSTWSLRTEGRAEWAQATLYARSCYQAAGSTKPLVKLIHVSDPRDTFVLHLLGIKVATIGDKSCLPLQVARMDTLRELFEAYCYIFDPVGAAGWWKGLHMPLEQKDEKQRNFDQWLSVHRWSHWENGEKAAISVLNPASSTSVDGGRDRIETKNVLPCHGECFFRASNGRYGLCPPMARKDDIAVVLQGGDVPLLLRPVDSLTDGSSGNKYQLVGECFLDGYMQGECFNAGFAAEVFEIV